MARFKTDRTRFIGGAIRKEGTEFSLSAVDIPKKLPEGMLELGGLTPAQKAAETKRLKAEAKAQKDANTEKQSVGADITPGSLEDEKGKSPDFMDGEVETK